MPKQTLLDMTQNILSDMDSDEVNSISDTSESLQVATIIKTTFYDLYANETIPEHLELFQFEGLSDVTQPNYLQYPSTMAEVFWFKYDSRSSITDTKINYTPISYVQPADFISRTESRDSSATNTTTITDASGIKLLIRTDVNPTFWTSFDDEYLVCDAYDSTIDTTLQKSKTQGYGRLEPVFTMSDTFTPDIDINLFPLLLSTAKAICFSTLKQQQNQAASAISRSHLVKQQNNRYKLRQANNINYPDYGRK
jgi:hypothetical protein